MRSFGTKSGETFLAPWTESYERMDGQTMREHSHLPQNRVKYRKWSQDFRCQSQGRCPGGGINPSQSLYLGTIAPSILARFVSEDTIESLPKPPLPRADRAS